jgi:hypothetical protein
VERELLGRMAPESNHFERWCPGEFLHPFTAKKRTPLRIGHTSYDVEELVELAARSYDAWWWTTLVWRWACYRGKRSLDASDRRRALADDAYCRNREC